MSDMFGPTSPGQTELTDDDRNGLKLSYIATRGDLDDAEQRNILAALQRRTPSLGQLLDDKYLRDLHRAMLGDVWTWAGRYRTRETNIGIEPSGIATAVRTLVGDTLAWVEYDAFEPDELAARFHHRLVQIHPFPNGNGRHGRIATDYLLSAMGQPPFQWGRGLAVSTHELRLRYRMALQQADQGSIDELLRFCRH